MLGRWECGGEVEEDDVVDVEGRKEEGEWDDGFLRRRGEGGERDADRDEAVHLPFVLNFPRSMKSKGDAR